MSCKRLVLLLLLGLVLIVPVATWRSGKIFLCRDQVGGGNSIMVLAPYWYEGTWVFDDASRGLIREPFVAGVPEMIDEAVVNIPNARDGFRLTFSAIEFPGFQKKLIWVRGDKGGNVYRFEDSTKEGWLCPAFFK